MNLSRPDGSVGGGCAALSSSREYEKEFVEFSGLTVTQSKHVMTKAGKSQNNSTTHLPHGSIITRTSFSFTKNARRGWELHGAKHPLARRVALLLKDSL